MEYREQTEEEIEINIGELMGFLLTKAGYILLAGIVLAIISLALTVFLMKPQYTSVTSMYVLNRQTNESVTNSDLQSSTYLTKDYMEIIKSRTVLESVIAKLGLEETYEGLLKSVSVSTASDTRIISIKVTDRDPYLAHDIAQNICTIAAAQIQKVMNTDAVNVVDQASIPTKKSSPNTKMNVLVAAAIGIIIAVLIFIIKFITNDKVTTSEDVERYLGIGILGSMPIDEEEEKQKKRRKKQEKKKRKNKRW